MKSRILLGVLLVVVFSAGTFATRGATRGDQTGLSRRWTLVNFADPVRVSGQLLMGPYLIIHDDAKMARGEACTSFYRFDPKTGPKEEAVSFHCSPAERQVCATATFTTIRDPYTGIQNLTEYQFAGDAEGHGVPK
jgi:hypothetical protein